jgi:peptidoglycan/LPS O-acetylase OafA/YrhL
MIAAAWIVLTTWLWLGAANTLISEIRKGIFCFLVGGVILLLDRSAISRLNPFSIVGRVSYSLYAFAAPVTYTLTVLGVPWWANLMSSILVGSAAYMAIERPMIALGRMLRAKENGGYVIEAAHSANPGKRIPALSNNADLEKG